MHMLRLKIKFEKVFEQSSQRKRFQQAAFHSFRTSSAFKSLRVSLKEFRESFFNILKNVLMPFKVIQVDFKFDTLNLAKQPDS